MFFTSVRNGEVIYTPFCHLKRIFMVLEEHL